LGKTLIILISSTSYSIYYHLLPILCVGTGFFYIGQALCNIGLALNQPKKYILPKIITGLITVILNIILIIYFGIKGIAFTVLLVGIIYSIFIYLVNKKILSEFAK
jgi:O-antigen/teichoic acid export membrane protein